MMNPKYVLKPNYMLRFLCCSFIITFLAPSIKAQQTTQTAPNFTLATLFQAPNNAPSKLSDLQGNIVILDFWATWCAPCRTSMNHLNQLAQKFVEKPVRFLAISKESVSIVERFIKSNPSKLWIGIDATGEAHKNYNVEDIPHTVIINKSGHLIAVTDSEEITEDNLNALLDGKDVQFASVVSAEQFLQRESEVFQKLTLPKAVLKLFDARGGNEETGRLFTPSYRNNTLQAITILPQLVSEAYQIPTKFIKIDSRNLARDRYYLHMQLLSNDKQFFRDTLKILLKQKVEVSIDTTLEKEKVWILKRNAAIKELQPSRAAIAEIKHTDSSFVATKQPIKTLVKYLTDRMYPKVLDASGFNAEYDMTISFDAKEPKSLQKELLRYGLEIIESEQPINIYVVKEKNAPNTVKQ